MMEYLEILLIKCEMLIYVNLAYFSALILLSKNVKVSDANRQFTSKPSKPRQDYVGLLQSINQA